MRYSSSAHTRFYHRFHVVRTTKYRYQVLLSPMRERIREMALLHKSNAGPKQRGSLSIWLDPGMVRVPPPT